MKYNPLNDFVIIQKEENSGLVVSGQNEDVNATLTGTVIASSPTSEVANEKVMFVRGHARKIILEGKEYFIIKEEKLLLWLK